MNEEHDHTDSTFTETMAARIEIKELGDLARQKEITDAVEAPDGIIETKVEKGALHVSYDPLATTEKKLSRLSAPPALRSKLRPRTRKARIQTCQHR